jgi:hypothetical protein
MKSSLLGLFALLGCTEITKTDWTPPDEVPEHRPSAGGSGPSFGSGGFGADTPAPEVGKVGGYGIDATEGGQIIALPFGANEVFGDSDGSAVLAGGYGQGLPGGGSGVVAALSVDRVSAAGYVESTAIAYTGEQSSATFGGAALDGLGNVYIAGSYRGLLTLNGVTMQSAVNPGPVNTTDPFDDHGKSSEDMFIFKLDRWGGVIWAWSIGGVADQSVSLTALAPDGSITLFGKFTGEFLFGQQALVSSGGSTVPDLVFLRLGADGLPLSARQFTSNVWNFRSMASDSGGNLLLGGDITGAGSDEPNLAGYDELDFGRGGFVLKVDSSFEPLWVTNLGQEQGPRMREVTLDHLDNVVVAAQGVEAADLFGEPVGDRGIVLAKLDPNGAPIFGRAYGNTLIDFASSATVLSDDSIAFTGIFYQDVDFDAGLLPSLEPGMSDVFVARVDPEGNHLMSLRAGGVGADYGTSIAALPLDRLITTGNFATAIDFGSGIVQNRGGPYVAWITP